MVAQIIDVCMHYPALVRYCFVQLNKFNFHTVHGKNHTRAVLNNVLLLLSTKRFSIRVNVLYKSIHIIYIITTNRTEPISVYILPDLYCNSYYMIMSIYSMIRGICKRFSFWFVCNASIVSFSLINSLWYSDAIWQHRSGSTLVQVMVWRLTAPSR